MTGIWSKLTLVYVCSRQNRCNIVSKYIELKNSVSPFSLCPSRSFLFHSECCFLLCCCCLFFKEKKMKFTSSFIWQGWISRKQKQHEYLHFQMNYVLVCFFSLFLAVITLFAVLLLSCSTVSCFVNDLCWFCCCWCFSFLCLLSLKHPWFGDDWEGFRCFHWKRFWQLI